MDIHLTHIKTTIYDKSKLMMSDFELESESKEYCACRFSLSAKNIICRNAKITPKKNGQFVTFWKRINEGPIQPFEETDPFHFFVINIRSENEFGQFVFPKSILIKKGIISTLYKEGKRAFRVYPEWDIPKSKQAQRTQKWQLNYFFKINDSTDLNRVQELYAGK